MKVGGKASGRCTPERARLPPQCGEPGPGTLTSAASGESLLCGPGPVIRPARGVQSQRVLPLGVLSLPLWGFCPRHCEQGTFLEPFLAGTVQKAVPALQSPVCFRAPALGQAAPVSQIQRQENALPALKGLAEWLASR